MFEALAGMFMAMKIHFSQINPFKKEDAVVHQYIYENKIKKAEEKEKYEKSRMPESGYMTVEEYEALSRGKSKKEIEVEEANIPKDSTMVYVPQKTFKLIKYNDPVGSPELNLPRRLNFDRQINAQGIVSGDKTMLVYPAVYYYAQSDCTACDLFLIKLDPSLNETERVKRANIIQKDETPLISTEKSLDEKYIFRTLTPIDFSVDNKKLAVKEKVGYRHDGIWKTDLWVYDFEKREARKLPQIREAIEEYWKYSGGIELTETRWDIYPMGFDYNNDDRIIVCAYAYTGNTPKFLGTWSIDTEGENSKLEDLDGNYIPVSTVGYRLAEDFVVDSSETEFEAKRAKEKEDKIKKDSIKAEKQLKEIKQLEYERKINQMNMDTLFKIRQRKEAVKNYASDSKDGLTGY